MPSDLTAAASRYTADDNQCQMAFLQDAFALADAMAAELDPTPLTFDHLRAMGWEAYDDMLVDSATHLQAFDEESGVSLYWGLSFIQRATLGDLRTLTRILTR